MSRSGVVLVGPAAQRPGRTREAVDWSVIRTAQALAALILVAAISALDPRPVQALLAVWILTAIAAGAGRRLGFGPLALVVDRLARPLGLIPADLRLERPGTLRRAALAGALALAPGSAMILIPALATAGWMWLVAYGLLCALDAARSIDLVEKLAGRGE